ncbi:DUF2059 domain-containing protein [Celeribacter marinus]|uniref:DUF2059 domain-containing protein n=1 Tax=Celeribacter marinus TaxID=1397108 RepID=A0A0P0A7S8_9RHOB|nr:DUF2059 domain-containing protein [Celeribacter marinus]ALI54449.1 hypothetical protein IMCC12053_500 [Celeribacter marinus]SFK77200.1 hypothetical protein SAMN05444421_10863 [Celeribacter marinus]
MLKNAFPAFAIAVSLVAACPAASETREERLAVATEYNDLAIADMDMGRVISQMYLPILTQIRTSGRTVTEAQEADIQDLYMEAFEQPMYEVMGETSGIMADMFTLDEIVALRDFYKTAEGRAVMVKMPDMIGAQQPMIIEMVTAKMPSVMEQLQDILEPK